MNDTVSEAPHLENMPKLPLGSAKRSNRWIIPGGIALLVVLLVLGYFFIWHQKNGNEEVTEVAADSPKGTVAENLGKLNQPKEAPPPPIDPAASVVEGVAKDGMITKKADPEPEKIEKGDGSAVGRVAALSKGIDSTQEKADTTQQQANKVPEAPAPKKPAAKKPSASAPAAAQPDSNAEAMKAMATRAAAAEAELDRLKASKVTAPAIAQQPAPVVVMAGGTMPLPLNIRQVHIRAGHMCRHVNPDTGAVLNVVLTKDEKECDEVIAREIGRIATPGAIESITENR